MLYLLRGGRRSGLCWIELLLCGNSFLGGKGGRGSIGRMSLGRRRRLDFFLEDMLVGVEDGFWRVGFAYGTCVTPNDNETRVDVRSNRRTTDLPHFFSSPSPFGRSGEDS